MNKFLPSIYLSVEHTVVISFCNCLTKTISSFLLAVYTVVDFVHTYLIYFGRNHFVQNPTAVRHESVTDRLVIVKKARWGVPNVRDT